MPRYKMHQKYIEITKGIILDAAVALFSTQGYDKTSLRDISRRAELSLSTVYNYFHNKNDLLHELYRSRWSRSIDRVTEELALLPSGPERLQAMFARLYRLFASATPSMRMILVHSRAMAHARAAEYLDPLDKLFGQMDRIINEEKAAGGLAETVDTPLLRLLLFSTAEGLPFHASTTPVGTAASSGDIIDGIMPVLRAIFSCPPQK